MPWLILGCSVLCRPRRPSKPLWGGRSRYFSSLLVLIGNLLKLAFRIAAGTYDEMLTTKPAKDLEIAWMVQPPQIETKFGPALNPMLLQHIVSPRRSGGEGVTRSEEICQSFQLQTSLGLMANVWKNAMRQLPLVDIVAVKDSSVSPIRGLKYRSE